MDTFNVKCPTCGLKRSEITTILLDLLEIIHLGADRPCYRASCQIAIDRAAQFLADNQPDLTKPEPS